MTVRPEILAPVGSPDCLPAAVAGGADAVYLGLRHFNARGRAENFRKADLAGNVAYLHHHRLKCYLVMNTLVHDDEFPKALDLAAVAADSGVDAVIVQDLGLWRVLARELPALKLHASTQQTIHHPSQVAVLAGLGAERVILARELTLAEVRACTDEARRHGVSTEHFVHGALCYAYSGQCLMSNFAGCRSANRGTCAQNCRFDYLVEGGKDPDTALSMKDFALVGHIAALADAGVASLKIEGRLKGADYVYTTSRVYRAAVDAWAAGRPFDIAAARDLLRDVFSRGHTDGNLAGEFGSTVRTHRYAPEQDRPADATLVALDRKAGRAEVRAAVAPRAGQGYSFAHGWYTGGFLVIACDALGGERWRLKIRTAEHGPALPAGLPLFRNSDHERKREAATAMAAVAVTVLPAATVAVRLVVRGAAGAPLTVVATAADGRRAEAASTEPLRPAANAPLNQELLRDKLGAFGGTGFQLGELRSELVGELFVPAAELKRLRRALVEDLAAAAIATGPADDDTEVPAAARWAPPEPGTPLRRTAELWVAVGSVAAAAAALAAGAAAVWLDDAALDLWAAAPPRLALDPIAAAVAAGKVWLRHPATPAPSPHLAALGLPVVAGHLGVIAAARAAGLAAVADQSLNVFNTQTLLALKDVGARAAVISLECSSREVARLAARCADLDAPALAVVVHGRLPAMLTRQDHGLGVGEQRAIRAVPRDGGLPYAWQRRAAGDTVVWEGRRLFCPEQALPTATLVDAWVLELGDLDAAAVAELCAAYLAARDGRLEIPELRAVAERHAPDGLFPGHLKNGSRELDLVLERQAAEA